MTSSSELRPHHSIHIREHYGAALHVGEHSGTWRCEGQAVRVRDTGERLKTSNSGKGHMSSMHGRDIRFAPGERVQDRSSAAGVNTLEPSQPFFCPCSPVRNVTHPAPNVFI